ncbi:jerky protein homolog-like [Onthophagus taurus]|uniref:jerky protein homolog-like n=1 Tax=Onthophagus taurus TaxID=166361 RepID=UPI0039BE320B
MPCANASGSHKLPLLCIGKSKNPRSFKETEMKHFPVCYKYQTKAWVNQDIFKAWFFEEFVPSVKKHLKSKHLLERAMLLLDNAPLHPEERTLQTADGQIFVQYLPPNVTALLQPMDQGVIEACKRRFRKIILRLLLEADCSLKEFWKKWNIKDAIYAAAESWGDVPNVTIQKSWFKVWPQLTENFSSSKNEESTVVTSRQLLNGIQNVVEFEFVDITDIEEWLHCDKNEPGYEVLNDTQIATISEPTATDATDEEDEDENVSTPEKKVPPEAALSHVDGPLSFLDQQNDTDHIDVLNLRKIRSNICLKLYNKKKQLQITDFFNQ